MGYFNIEPFSGLGNNINLRKSNKYDDIYKTVVIHPSTDIGI